MQQITVSEIFDEYRIEYGTILQVQKYRINRETKFENKELKSRTMKKKVKGVRSVFQLKKDTVDDSGEVALSQGEYVYSSWGDSYYKLDILTDPNEFYFEIRCLGGTIEGVPSKSMATIEKIRDFVKETYGV